MYKHIVVPTTGGGSSWRAVVVGCALAARFGAGLEIYSVVSRPEEIPLRESLLKAQLAADRPETLLAKVTTEVVSGTTTATIARHLAAISDVLPVMASAAHGRSEPLLGSVTEELLSVTSGPVVVVGPHFDTDRVDFSGDLVVAVDGSAWSEAVLGPATVLARQLALRPWVTTVLDPSVPIPHDVSEGAYAAGVAHRLQGEIGREVEYEVLRHPHPAQAIVEFANDVVDASMIVAATHGRTGLARIAIGSVAMSMVHHAHVPVVLVRPAVIATAYESVAKGMATT